MIRGDGQPDRRDQASRLRELAGRRRPRGHTLAIASGKGGVGKSNLAANLSIVLALRGLRVTLIDMDMGLANVDLLLNVKPRYNLAHVLAGTRSIEEVAVVGPGGVRFVAGSSGAHELADLSDFERQSLVLQVDKLARSADIVVLDCGAGISRNVTCFALAVDQVMVVTTPEPTALTDAYATIKTLYREECKGRVSLFVNRAGNRAEARATYRRLADVAQRFLDFSVADGGYMLQDTSVELAVQRRTPFVIRDPACNASACIGALADELVRSCAVGERQGGFLKRVVGLFV